MLLVCKTCATQEQAMRKRLVGRKRSVSPGEEGLAPGPSVAQQLATAFPVVRAAACAVD